MARLTEEMVIARSKQSDLASIKKLNCWGSDLSDVSIIRRMRGVEVLALSVNKISGLSDFEDCLNLQELYLRKNNIKEINDLVYLQNLPKLKFLWLEENPLVDSAGPNYRAIVLRALPNLKKLDNVEVTPEEVQDAMRGPAPMQQSPQDVYEQEQQYNERNTQQSQQQYRQQSPLRDQTQPSPENTESDQCISDPIDTASVPSPMQRTPPSQENNYSPTENNSQVISTRYQNNRGSYHQQYNDRSPGSGNDSPVGGGIYRENSGRERVPIAPSMSTHSMKEYYQSDYQRPQQPPAHYRHSQTDLTEWDDNQSNHNTPAHRVSREYPYRNGNGPRSDDWDEERERERRRSETNSMRRSESRFNDSASVISTAVLNHLAGIHRRPVNRSSNLLSATLCLVKELDYPSLEVVEHAVRCRLDELAE